MPPPDIHLINKSTEELAKHITQLHFQHNPGLLDRYGAAGKVRCYEDAVFHLNFLAESMTMNLPDMYANWREKFGLNQYLVQEPRFILPCLNQHL